MNVLPGISFCNLRARKQEARAQKERGVLLISEQLEVRVPRSKATWQSRPKVISMREVVNYEKWDWRTISIYLGAVGKKAKQTMLFSAYSIGPRVPGQPQIQPRIVRRGVEVIM